MEGMLELRPYQRECLSRLHACYKEGRRRVLVALPTGTGKTVVFAQFPRFFRMKRRLLVLAHREELLLQAADKFAQVDPELKVEIEQAGRQASGEAAVVVASVPTLGRRGSTRLARLDPESFYLIVVDEAHHAVASTYRRIFDHFSIFAPGSQRMLVGFTATPFRGDGQGLGAVFEEIAYSRSLEEMITSRFLCPVTGWRVRSDVDLTGVRVQAGDFVESQLAARVNVEARNALVLKAFRELAPHRRALVFCADVAHTLALAATFREAGVATAAVFGAMPKPERATTLARFSRGELQVVTNCNLLTEGFDEPRLDCLIMARPTKSRLLYAQMVGRGTRLHPDKRDLVVIDVVDNSQRHSLRGLHTLFNLPARLELRGASAVTVAEAIARLSARFPWVDVDQLRTPEDVAMAAERIELFSFDPPEAIDGLTRFVWQRDAGEGYRLPLPEGEVVEVTPSLLDDYEIHLHQHREGQRLLLHRTENLPSAIRFADRFVAKHRPDAVRLVDQEARWRDREPTENQLRILAERGVPTPSGLTRGQVSWMISLLSGRRV